MPSNFTENYSLSQWERTDQVRMEDFNADNAKLDAALKAGADARAALQTALNAKGNCRIVCQTYTGNGSKSRTFTFPGKPLIVFFGSTGVNFLALVNGATVGNINFGGAPYPTNISWSGNSVYLSAAGSYGGDQCMNGSGLQYTVIALIAAD